MLLVITERGFCELIDSKRRTALARLLVLVPLGCSAPPRTAVQPTSRSACAIAGTASAAPESVSVAASTPIDAAHAPIPADPAERFAFAHVYETLINVDCEGRAYAGLAGSWSMDATKTRVTLSLRKDARFSDRRPVLAADVVAAWRATAERSTGASRMARLVADAATIVDDRTLTVSLPDTSWLVLAEPALAVYRARPGSTWPVGSGPYRAASDTASSSESLELVPLVPGSAPRIELRARLNGDPRDAIDAGAAVVVTGDRAALSYAASRADLSTVPLPWSRVYVVAIPRSGPTHADSSLRSMASDSGLRASLARDAVRTEARAAEPPYWWNGATGCGAAGVVTSDDASVGVRRSSRIVYDREDAVARGLAERLVAVERGVMAAGLATADFARALRAGDERAYVLALPRASLSPCQDLAPLATAAPWLVSDSGLSELAVIPLVETRERAIVHRDRVSAEIDWDGTLRFGGAPRAP